MSSNLGDQGRVEQLASDYPREIIPAFGMYCLFTRRLRCDLSLTSRIAFVPAGLHPWWSHHISFEDTLPEKEAHYRNVFPDYFDHTSDPSVAELLDSFPDPTLFSSFLTTTLRPYLEAHSNAMLGEVGLDKSFRIPKPEQNPKTDWESGERVRKRLTKLQTPIEHQLKLLRSQLDLAFELNRNISMHSVQAQGATVDLLQSLSKDPKWIKSKSKIDLHSYGGSAETISRMMAIHKDRLYFSFSTTINARLPRLEDLIRSVPDGRLLVESDFPDVRLSQVRIWEILGIVCDAKGWEKEHAVNQLKENWQRFVGDSA